MGNFRLFKSGILTWSWSLNVKEPLAQSRRKIWSLKQQLDSNPEPLSSQSITEASLAKRLSVRFWTKWLWVRVQLLSLKHAYMFNMKVSSQMNIIKHEYVNVHYWRLICRVFRVFRDCELQIMGCKFVETESYKLLLLELRVTSYEFNFETVSYWQKCECNFKTASYKNFFAS